ncbi:MAG: hypothetical protein ACTSPD_10000 [Promethearchaeota archaeon]
MHSWGDKNVDWKGIDNAMMMIVKELKKYRICIRQYKEKFGTVRIYCSLGWYCLRDITHPGHARHYNTKWLRYLDIYYVPKLMKFVNYIVLPIHKKVYRNAYKKACDKYPHLKEEICCMADYVDLLDFYKSPWRKV